MEAANTDVAKAANAMAALTLTDVTVVPPVPQQTFSYTLYEPSFAAPEFGLNNNGAICWMNAITQVFFGLSSFNQKIRRLKDNLADNNVAMSYINIADALFPNSDEYEPINPIQFSGSSQTILHAMLRELAAMNAASSGGNIGNGLGLGQQCADEGYTTFLGMMKSAELDDLFNNVYEQIIICTRCNEQVSSNRDKSNRIYIPPTKNFPSEAAYQAWRSTNVAGLPFDHPNRHVIRNFTSAAEFKNWLCNHVALALDYKCPKCSHVMAKVARGEKLKALREIIAIKFDRINAVDPTWFPPQLEFGSTDGKTLTYEVVGKICWSGSFGANGQSGGHYWAHSRRPLNGSPTAHKWYLLNDNSVSNGNGAPEQTTYMVFYHLMRNE